MEPSSSKAPAPPRKESFPPKLPRTRSGLSKLFAEEDRTNDAQDPPEDKKNSTANASESGTSSQPPRFHFVREDSNMEFVPHNIPDPNNFDLSKLPEEKRAPLATSFTGSDQSILEALNRATPEPNTKSVTNPAKKKETESEVRRPEGMSDLYTRNWNLVEFRLDP